MKENESKLPAKTHTGMIKRANPLSLEKATEVSQAPGTPVKKKTTETKANTSAPIDALKGPKQLAMFLPSFNKALVTAIKAEFPELNYVQAIEKAWLLLLAQEKPKAYADLLAALKKDGLL
jgi:hypothetical protein